MSVSSQLRIWYLYYYLKFERKEKSSFVKELINLFGNQKKDEGRPKSDLITAQVSEKEQEGNKNKSSSA